MATVLPERPQLLAAGHPRCISARITRRPAVSQRFNATSRGHRKVPRTRVSVLCVAMCTDLSCGSVSVGHVGCQLFELLADRSAVHPSYRHSISTRRHRRPCGRAWHSVPGHWQRRPMPRASIRRSGRAVVSFRGNVIHAVLLTHHVTLASEW